MAKLSDRTELTTPADGDLYVTTDVSDTTDAATGTDKKITWANLKAGFKTYFDTLYAAALGADDNYVTDAEKAALHAAVTVADSSEIDLTLTGQQISASIVAGSIDETKLDASVNASLDLADSAVQPAAIGTTVQAYDADLTTWAGITPGTGVGTALAVNVGSAGAVVTNGGALGTPSSGTLTNCTGLPLSGVVDSTSEALGVGTLELGHASDTTISRVSAGVAAIEGNNIITANIASSVTVAGVIEVATAAETTTGTDATRAVSPDGLAGSDYGKRHVTFVLNGTTALTTSEAAYWRVPSTMNGWNLVAVGASVGTGAAGSSSSGNPTFTVTNITQSSAAMLSTALTVDANEYTSASAATAAVIDTANDDVATDDLIKIAVTTAGTGTTYATVTLTFQLP